MRIFGDNRPALPYFPKDIPHYDDSYNYEHTAFIHFARLPLVGRFLQAKLNPVLLEWQERINWTMFLERQSYSTLIVGLTLLCIAAGLRRLICWYGRRLSIAPIGPWEQLRHGGIALFSAAPAGESRGGLRTT